MDASPLPAHAIEGLLEELKADQRRRWQQGQSLPVEDYLRQHPQLRDEPDAVLDLIDNEVLQRRQRGEVPRVEDYRSRFPHLAADLALWFQVEDVFPTWSGGLGPEAGAPGEVTPETVPGEPVATGSPCPQCQALVEPGAGTCLACGAPLSVRDLLPPPPGLPQVAGYEVLERIGKGGMGVVYKARQLSCDRLVALKTLRSSDLAEPEVRARFEREAWAVARLAHPNIVQVFEVGTQPVPFFSMELLEGGSLDNHLRAGTLVVCHSLTFG